MEIPGQISAEIDSMIDLRADSRKYGVFDDLMGMDAPAFTNEIRRASTSDYGTAGPEFVRKLIEHNITGEDIRKIQTAFVEAELKKWPDISGQAARVAARLGLIAAAGELAIEFGIVPWGAGTAREAASIGLQDWLTARGDAKPYEEAQAIAQVRGIIERFGDSRFDDPSANVGYRGGGDKKLPDPRLAGDRLGYWSGWGASRTWLIWPETWRNVVCAGLDARLVAQTLEKHGMLETNPNGEKGRKSVVKKLFGKSVRFYVVTTRIFEEVSYFSPPSF
jgi:putative DNA primase/helicase